MQEALTNAKMRSAASGGPGLEGRIRGGLEKLREGDTAWTPDESAQLNNAIVGTPLQNTMRQVGRHLGGVPLIGELGTGVGTGIVMGHPVAGLTAAAVPGVIGLGSRAMSTAMAKSAAKALRQTVRAGGKKPTRITPNTEMLARALATYGAQQGSGQ